MGKATGPLTCARVCSIHIATGAVLLGLRHPAKPWGPRGMERRDAGGTPRCSAPPYPLSPLQLRINTRGRSSPQGTPPQRAGTQLGAAFWEDSR